MNLYADEQVAAVYDLETAALEDDIPFYAHLAKRQPGKVLELACGTGRVLMPLARAGVVVTGIDASEAMLDRCEAKMETLPAAAQSNVTLGRFDMQDFRLPHSFDMAYIAARSYILLTTVADEEAMLRNVHKHLFKNGLLAIDTFGPDAEVLAQLPGHVTERSFTDGERSLVRRDTLVVHDRLAQTRTMQTQYELKRQDGAEESFVAEWTIRYSYPLEIQHLIRLCGFKIEAVYGSPEGDPFDTPGGRLLVVARKL
jgi:SAM-dependent methyltransferase